MYYLLPIFILLLGLVLIIVFTPIAWRKTSEEALGPRANLEPALEEAPLLEHLQSLEVQIDLLKDDFSSLKNQVQPPRTLIDHQESQGGKNELSFETILAQKQGQGALPEIELYRAVFQAYDAGKSLTEIARELGRGKGEIELILNLRR